MTTLLFMLLTAVEESSNSLEWLQWLPAIISAVLALPLAWMNYNQRTKDKMTDAKIEKLKNDEQARNDKRADNSSKIYGMLWELLFTTNASRVYIIQPHPLTNNIYVTIRLEVKANGVSGMAEVLQKFPMADIAGFAGELSTRDFIIYKKIEDIKDQRARALFSNNGCRSCVIKRLSDAEHDWIGSIVCDFTDLDHSETDAINSTIYIKGQLLEVAENIQYILPEIR